MTDDDRRVNLDDQEIRTRYERISVMFSPAGRIREAIKARAGMAPTARFRPGELARMARCDEETVLTWSSR